MQVMNTCSHRFTHSLTHSLTNAGDAITAFNLKEEREIGRFNDDGSFVFKKEQDIGNSLTHSHTYILTYSLIRADPWLEGVEESELEKMIASAAAGKKRLEERKQKEEENDGPSNSKKLSQMELKMAILKFMLPGETVTKSMNRYSSKNKVWTHSLTHSLTYSLTHSLTYSFIHLLIHSFIYSLTHSLIHSFIHLLTYSFTHSLTHSLIYLMTEKCVKRR